MKNIKKYLNQIVLTLLISTSFLSLNSATVVKQLISLQQKTSDCAYFAAFNANCMVNGKDINEIQDLLLAKLDFDKLLADFKYQAGSATDIDGQTLDVCVLPFLSNDKITIIESLEQLKQLDFIPETLTIGITNFKLHGTPHAVLYNMGGHWIALGIIKDKIGQTIIIQADSAGKGNIESEITPAEDYFSKDGAIEDILYKMFNNGEVTQEAFVPQTKDSKTIAREEEDLRLAREMQKKQEEEDASFALAMQLQMQLETPAKQDTQTTASSSDEELARLLQEEEQTLKDAEFARRLYETENAQGQRPQQVGPARRRR